MTKERPYVRDYTVSNVMQLYYENKLYVNRKYQRKLVWGLKEKQDLIDSLINGVPLPSILAAQYDVMSDEGSKVQITEVIDGMQRLNAIIGFLLGEFSINVDGKDVFFNPQCCTSTMRLLHKNKLQVKESLLDFDICVELVDRPTPFILTENDDETIRLIFSRINSTGRKISSQDLRQSSAIGEFPDLVRRIASRIRKDYTYSDKICLCDMAKISIGPVKHGYGVDIDTVFWRKHDIINASRIKESADEELIEVLLATRLLGARFKKSKDSLDDLYNPKTLLGRDIESQVNEYGKDSLEDLFTSVFDTIDAIFDSVNSTFSQYLFTSKQVKNKDECFKILFLAIERLLEEGYVLENYADAAKVIKNAANIITDCAAASIVNYSKSLQSVENLYCILKSNFYKKIVTGNCELEQAIDKRLCYSSIESQLTEFKIGVSYFEEAKVNDELISSIAKTLVAMANVNNPKEVGMVIIGIANSRKSFLNWHSVYQKQALICNQHYVPGITDEAMRLYKSTDAYFNQVMRLLQREPISDKLKEYVLQNMQVANYHDKEVLLLQSTCVGEISTYNGEKYVRHANSTERVTESTRGVSNSKSQSDAQSARGAAKLSVF